MNQRIEINENITVAGQPTRAELEKLAAEGFKTIVNMRTDGEEDQPLSPSEEGDVVRKHGMKYVHFPVSKEEMGPELEDEFRQQLPSFESPAFIHCSSGKRAGAFVVMDQAVKEGWSGEATLEKADEMGFECKEVEIRDFVKSYVDSHR